MSFRKLSQALGKSDGYIAEMLRDRTEPSAAVMVHICHIFGITVDTLLYQRQENGRPAERVVSDAEARQEIHWDATAPSMTDVKHWAVRSGGRLENWNHLKSYVELFDHPDTSLMVPKPVVLGPLSIASQLMALNEPIDLITVFERFKSINVANWVAECHLDTFAQGIRYDDDLGMAIRFQSGRLVTVKYERLLLKVQDGSDTRVMNFSRLKRKTELLEDNRREIAPTDDSEMILTRFGTDGG